MNDRKLDFVVTAYVVDEGKVLLIHHKKHNLWLPPGGHIEVNETPDDALRRELREEVGIEFEFLQRNDLPKEGNIREQLALPFYVNVHSVGDHDHCSLFYVVRALNPEAVEANLRELKAFEWFSEQALKTDPRVPADVRNQALAALKVYGRE